MTPYPPFIISRSGKAKRFSVTDQFTNGQIRTSYYLIDVEEDLEKLAKALHSVWNDNLRLHEKPSTLIEWKDEGDLVDEHCFFRIPGGFTREMFRCNRCGLTLPGRPHFGATSRINAPYILEPNKQQSRAFYDPCTPRG